MDSLPVDAFPRTAAGRRGRRARRLVVLRCGLAVATIGLVASLPGVTGAGAATARTATGAASPAAATQVSLALISDSGGTVPAKGDTVTLLFTGSSTVEILYTSSSGDLSYTGTYTYSGGTMTLSFTNSSFSHHASFAFSPSDRTVKIPFQALSFKPGSSTWSVGTADPVAGALDAADAAAAASANGASQSSIVDAAANYVAEMSGAPVTADPSFATTSAVIHGRSGGVGAAELTAAFSEAGPAPDARVVSTAPPHNAAQNASTKITAIEKFPTDVLLTFANSVSVDVNIMYGFTTDGPFKSFTPGPFYGTPAVVQKPQSPGNPISDPPNKTALFIEPFLGSDIHSWSLDNGLTAYKGIASLGATYLTADTSALETTDGYHVNVLKGTEANVQGIIGALSGSDTPGFIEFSSHGNSNGSLLTDDFMGHSQQAASNALIALARSLHLAYSGKNQALGLGTGPDFTGAENVPLYAEIYPPFWTWLRAHHGANFSKSLVYVNACLTDSTPALHNAIHARAFFGYKISVTTNLGDAVENYLVQMLSRHSFTAEEAYYNMLRIDSTSQTVYQQDNIFEHAFTAQQKSNSQAEPGEAPGPATNILNVLGGWGYANGQEINYIGHGWLTSKKDVDQGGIFYLVTAARFGQDVKKGLSNLATCWNAWWKNGKLPGLSSPYCQQANAGYPPTQSDYHYAIYLLDGAKGTFDGTFVPRFTLADGASA